MIHSSKIAPVAPVRSRSRRAGRAALAFGLVTALSACGGVSTYRGYDSIHQPVVTRSQTSVDLAAGSQGLAPGERARLDGWFEALGLRYGDRIAIEDPLASPQTRDAVQQAAAKYGLLIASEVPVTQGQVNPGIARVVVTRSTAAVPGCPDWSSNSESNFLNGTHSNYGCATNGNLAAMVADPEDLLRGAHGGGLSNVQTSDKAIGAFGARAPTGASGTVKAESSKGS